MHGGLEGAGVCGGWGAGLGGQEGQEWVKGGGSTTELGHIYKQ